MQGQGWAEFINMFCPTKYCFLFDILFKSSIIIFIIIHCYDWNISTRAKMLSTSSLMLCKIFQMNMVIFWSCVFYTNAIFWSMFFVIISFSYMLFNVLKNILLMYSCIVVIFFDNLQSNMFKFQFLIFSRIKYNASMGEIKFHHISVINLKLVTYLHYIKIIWWHKREVNEYPSQWSLIFYTEYL